MKGTKLFRIQAFGVSSLAGLLPGARTQTNSLRYIKIKTYSVRGKNRNHCRNDQPQQSLYEE
jgi:hypothetical protein